MAEENVAWHSTLDADHQAHITSRGWEKLDPAAAAAEAVKAHLSATKLIGVPETQLLRLPKDAQDPSYQGVLDRVLGMATPKTAEEYSFDGIKSKLGADLTTDELAFVRGIASELKLTTGQARIVAAKLVDRTEGAATQQAEGSAGRLASNIEALRQAWNTEYDQKVFSAQSAGEQVGFTPEVFKYMGSLPTQEYIKNMNALVFLGAQMTEASLHRGGRQPEDLSAGMNPQQASAELDRLKGDPAWGKKFLEGDAATLLQFDRLNARMHAELRR
ncbi:MAG: hypothetical protein ACRDRB_04155 [Pseudonocardiaceae bacterium]